MTNMGLAYKEVVRQPRYSGTVVCPRCDAEYKPSPNWCMVWYSDGTSGDSRIMGRIDEKICPICRTPREV